MTKKNILYTYQFENMIHNTHTYIYILYRYYIDIYYKLKLQKTLNILTDKNYIIIQWNLLLITRTCISRIFNSSKEYSMAHAFQFIYNLNLYKSITRILFSPLTDFSYRGSTVYCNISIYIYFKL